MPRKLRFQWDVNLYEGMRVYVHDNGEITEETVTQLEAQWLYISGYTQRFSRLYGNLWGNEKIWWEPIETMEAAETIESFEPRVRYSVNEINGDSLPIELGLERAKTRYDDLIEAVKAVVDADLYDKEMQIRLVRNVVLTFESEE